jgi:AraC family transcriptional regulator
MERTLISPDRIQEWIPGTVTMDSTQCGWSGITLKGYQYGRQVAAIPPMRDYMIVAYDSAPTFMRRTSGGPWQKARVGKGRISLLTRAEESTWSWADPISVKHVYLSHDDLETTAVSVFDRDPKSIEINDCLSVEDPFILTCIHLLESELKNGEIGQRLIIDALRSQIAVHLLRQYAKVSLDSDTNSNLSPAQRHRIIDLVESSLGDNLSLEGMAASIGFSQFHFARQFKAEFGLAPYEYVLRKRISRAREMLRWSKAPLKVIALDCGFADQSHFSRTFRKMTGVTPAKFRRLV